MKHRFMLEGYGYRLRPVRLSDAQFIIDVRLEDMQRNRFIHTISADVGQQEAWLQAYFERDGDYYFVIENRLTGLPEGLIAFYHADSGAAEWGRWVIKKGSLAAAESVYLLYRIAFEQAGLQELYCRTVTENTAVVSLHNSIGELTRFVHRNFFELNGVLYDAVEQYSDRTRFYETIAPELEKKSQAIYQRNLKRIHSSFSFHHIGIASKALEKDLPAYALFGYEKEGGFFEDPMQGIRGIFLTAKDQPRIELLENLDGSHTLDIPLAQNQKMYHAAYYVDDIEKAIQVLSLNRAKMISPLKESVYFGKRICFMMLPNMMMIELLEV